MSKFLNTTHKTIAWIKQVNDNDGELIMKPPFQRNLVWTNSQKSYLIPTFRSCRLKAQNMGNKTPFCENRHILDGYIWPANPNLSEIIYI